MLPKKRRLIKTGHPSNLIQLSNHLGTRAMMGDQASNECKLAI
jgi:hypothetical protein